MGGLVLYAWPHLQLRETARAQDRMSRERERLLEENRKLRLEKASLENLRRVETIATRELGPAVAAGRRGWWWSSARARRVPGAQVAKELGTPSATSPAGERN